MIAEVQNSIVVSKETICEANHVRMKYKVFKLLRINLHNIPSRLLLRDLLSIVPNIRWEAHEVLEDNVCVKDIPPLPMPETAQSNQGNDFTGGNPTEAKQSESNAGSGSGSGSVGASPQETSSSSSTCPSPSDNLQQVTRPPP